MIILKQPVETNNTTMLLGKEVKVVENGWGIGFDEMNIILYKLGISTNQNSKSYGEVTKTAEGYYPNLSACIRGMVNKQLILDGDTSASLEELNKNMDAFCKDVWEGVNNLVNNAK